MLAIIATDGSAIPNPGWMQIGALIMNEKQEVVKKISRKLTRGTNNQAEIMALLEGVHNAKELGYDEIIAYTDSELLYKHFNGSYRLTDKKLKDLHKTLKYNVKDLKNFTLKWHARESDLAQRADELSRVKPDASVLPYPI